MNEQPVVMPPLDAAAIETRLRETFAPTHLEVRDDSHLHAGHAGAREGRHFSVHLVSARFDGMPHISRHRLVHEALGDWMRHGIHALALTARSPREIER